MSLQCNNISHWLGAHVNWSMQWGYGKLSEWQHLMPPMRTKQPLWWHFHFSGWWYDEEWLIVMKYIWYIQYVRGLDYGYLWITFYCWYCYHFFTQWFLFTEQISTNESCDLFPQQWKSPHQNTNVFIRGESFASRPSSRNTNKPEIKASQNQREDKPQ